MFDIFNRCYEVSINVFSGNSSKRDRSRSDSRTRGVPRDYSRSPSLKREKSYSPPPVRNRDSNKSLKLSKRSPSPALPENGSKGSVESLSIEETNKLRASLGLPPLKLEKSIKKVDSENNKEADDDNNKEGKLIPNSTVRHKPAENLREKSNTEKMRERLQQRKMKRQQENKLMTISSLGADDGVDDTKKWLQSQKKKEKEKKAAEKRAKMLEELDDEFGVGNIVKEDVQQVSKVFFI